MCYSNDQIFVDLEKYEIFYTQSSSEDQQNRDAKAQKYLLCDQDQSVIGKKKNHSLLIFCLVLIFLDFSISNKISQSQISA